jgi:MFS-type transporter involved in bile tolerance (Atg22 family)
MFVAGPGETDVFLIVVVLILITVVLLVGVFYFSLHALPERMAHGADKMKLQFVGILSLIAMFTHNNYFWIAALLIAAIELPDFLSPIKSLARSVKAQTVLLKARDTSDTVNEPTNAAASED